MSISSFVDRIRQHPGKEQVELKVRIKVPGNVFPGLTPTERAQHYEAQATHSCAPLREGWSPTS